jgi:hypothetical protein
MHGAYLSLSKPADDPKGALEGSRASRAQGFADRQIVDNHAGGSSGKSGPEQRAHKALTHTPQRRLVMVSGRGRGPRAPKSGRLKGWGDGDSI